MPSVSRGRHAGLLVPLFSMPSTSSWGVGEIADIPVMAAWLRECGLDMLQLLPLNEMAAGQNSPYCALSALALDPHLHFRDAHSGIPGPWRHRAPRRRHPRSSAAGAGRDGRSTTRRSAASSTRRSTPRSGISSTRNGDRDRRAPASSRRSGVNRRGGCATTHCSARSTNASTRVRGPTGRTRCAIATRPRWSARASSSTTVFCSTSTCSGSRRRSGRRRGASSRASNSSATSRSWCRATALTCGCVRPSSISARRSVSRRTRSARRGRIGGCRSIAGTCTSGTTMAGYASAPGAARDLYDGYRIDHLVGFYRTYAIPRDGDTVLRSGRSRGADRPGRAADEDLLQLGGPHHRGRSRHGAGLRA